MSIDSDDARAGGTGIRNVRVVQPEGRAGPISGEVLYYDLIESKLTCISDTRTDPCITWSR